MRKRKTKNDKAKIKGNATFYKSKEDKEPASSGIKVKPFFLMEKITSKRDIIKISHIKNMNTEDFGGISGSKLSHQPRGHPKIFKDDSFEDISPKNISSSSHTPVPREGTNPQNCQKMNELKLFTRMEA